MAPRRERATRRPRGTRGRDSAQPSSTEEALGRAREHGRRAALEGLAALRALLDGAALAAAGTTGEGSPLLAPAVTLLQEMEQLLSSEGGRAPALLDSLLAALDTEIARWEERSRHDSDARPVLRTFLGLREMLWEIGVRRASSEAGPQEGPARPPPPRDRPRSARLERVPVEG